MKLSGMMMNPPSRIVARISGEWMTLRYKPRRKKTEKLAYRPMIVYFFIEERLNSRNIIKESEKDSR